MSQIVHITFEKLTGLKGEIEGDFEVISLTPIVKGPAVLRYTLEDNIGALFSQHDSDFAIMFLPSESEHNRRNYIEHFVIGRNFLIKSWSYGGGVTINSQPPN